MKAQLEMEKKFMRISSVILYLFPEQALPYDSHHYIYWKLMGDLASYLMALFIAVCLRNLYSQTQISAYW